jgi:hypothetical protein
MSRLYCIAVAIIAAGCGPETTSFRTTDKGDGSDLDHPARAAYDVGATDRRVAHIEVWSSGGYIGNADQPMTHVGFEVENTGHRTIVFDGDALSVVVFDNAGAMLPPTTFVVIAPLGPSQISVSPGATVTLDSYFKLHVRPRIVDSMRVRWSVRVDDERYDETTNFVRDDDYPVLDNRPNGVRAPPQARGRQPTPPLAIR